VWWRKLDNIFSRFDTVPACYRRTDGRTDRQTDRRTSSLYLLRHFTCFSIADARKNAATASLTSWGYISKGISIGPLLYWFKHEYMSLRVRSVTVRNLRLARNRLLRFQAVAIDRNSHRHGRDITLTDRWLTVIICGGRLTAGCDWLSVVGRRGKCRSGAVCQQHRRYSGVDCVDDTTVWPGCTETNCCLLVRYIAAATFYDWCIWQYTLDYVVLWRPTLTTASDDCYLGQPWVGSFIWIADFFVFVV